MDVRKDDEIIEELINEINDQHDTVDVNTSEESEYEKKAIEDTVVKVDNVSVRFNIASERIDNLKEYFIKLIRKELMFKEFFALKDVSLEIKRGEAWGFIGISPHFLSLYAVY